MKARTQAILDWIVDRLGENSTWRGLIGLATAAGITLEPDQSTKIIAVGMGLIALINTFRAGAPTKRQVAEALETKQDKQ
jgi:hypothetical protein